MAGITLDFNNTFDGTIEDGTYEVIITKVEEDASQSGTDFTQFTLTIRNDIDQKHKNMNIFHRIWVSKETGKYNMKMFNTIGKYAKLPQGKTYRSMEELLQDYIGKPLKVRVKNETSEWNGKKYENLNVKKWDFTDFPNVQHQHKQSNANNNPFAETAQISDDQLPF